MLILVHGRIRIKICGITNPDDARDAVAAGADALGFVFHLASPRAIQPAAAAAIIQKLPPFIGKVGVFVDATAEEIEAVARQTGIDTVQLHGAESAAFCARIGRPVIKGFRVRDAASIASLEEYRTAAWLLDAFVPGQEGGTGVRFDWDLAAAAVLRGRPVILAGGLSPDNVAEAIARVRPYAVDVSSGVERGPGRKDAARMRAFVEAARA
ncbi:MAG TPA: phosphoribosylanthranilate isomerase [Candidatus Paceibacterota bacterium]|nr:phosphoribosylanthranilate isomerase [Candidatus Paceibacterota bacterium]